MPAHSARPELLLRLVETANRMMRKLPPAVLYGIGAVHVGWLFWLGLTGGLGVEPIKALEHAYGETGLQLLVVVLAVSPLRRFAGLNLLKFRRALGLLTFFYIAAHLLVWLVLDVQIMAQIWTDVVKRPYITIGMLGFVLMLPLAVTSNNWSLRKLGRKWRRLHRLTYLVALLGAAHFVMLVKGFQLEPLLYLLVVVGLLCLRLDPRHWRLFSLGGV